MSKVQVAYNYGSLPATTDKLDVCNIREFVEEGVTNFHGGQWMLTSVVGRRAQVNLVSTWVPSIHVLWAYTPTSTVDGDCLRNLLHDAGLEVEGPTVKKISSGDRHDDLLEAAILKMCKDHSNQAVRQLIRDSNMKWLREASQADIGNNHPENYAPCATSVRLCAINPAQYGVELQQGIENLRRARMTISDTENTSTSNCVAPSTQVASKAAQALAKLRSVMDHCNHLTYRGKVYRLEGGSQHTFVPFTNADTYIDQLMANPSIGPYIVDHDVRLKKLLSNTDNPICDEVVIDYDLIEVDADTCFSFKRRDFVPTPPEIRRERGRTPRAYRPYDWRTPPHPKYFDDSVMNSFPDLATRIQFLNKFYVGFMSNAQVFKLRKLCCVGAKNSGKTSWTSIYKGIIPSEHIAYVTKEKNFPFSQFNADTQLGLIDEWKDESLAPEILKVFLAGGDLPVCRKFQDSSILVSKIPIYITTNDLPDFGEDQATVEDRLHIFRTKELPRNMRNQEVDKIFKRNVMDYIHYMASMINQHRNDGFIDPDDLFYEDASHETGSSQRHDQGVMDEFARLRSFVLPFEASGTASYIPRDQNRVHESFIRAASSWTLQATTTNTATTVGVTTASSVSATIGPDMNIQVAVAHDTSTQSSQRPGPSNWSRVTVSSPPKGTTVKVEISSSPLKQARSQPTPKSESMGDVSGLDTRTQISQRPQKRFANGKGRGAKSLTIAGVIDLTVLESEDSEDDFQPTPKQRRSTVARRKTMSSTPQTGVAQQGNVQFHIEKPNTTAVSPQLQPSQAWTIDEDVLLATDPSDIIGTPIATQNLLSDTTTDILANLDDSH